MLLILLLFHIVLFRCILLANRRIVYGLAPFSLFPAWNIYRFCDVTKCHYVPCSDAYYIFSFPIRYAFSRIVRHL